MIRSEQNLIERRATSTREAGFSLLEVLAATAILALALGLLLQGSAGGLRNVRTGDAHFKAMTVAEAVLAQTGRVWPLRAGTIVGLRGYGT